jgi:hypothetical protein
MDLFNMIKKNLTWQVKSLSQKPESKMVTINQLKQERFL